MATVSQLWKSIDEMRRRSATGQYFLPSSDLRALFTKIRIESAVAELECAEHERIGLAAKIFEQGLTTFAILIWMKREVAIIDFRNHDALDASLPLHEDRAVQIACDFGKALAVEVQWQFLPYTLKHDMCDHHRIIDNNNTILPFLRQEPLIEGGFGEISKVTVLSSQQEFFPEQGDEVTIIRKRLKIRPKQSKESASRAFREEILCLKLLHRLRHSNIVPLLGSYTHNGEQNFLFPCLDMDLNMFFKLDQRYGDFKWDFTFFDALYGLASALNNVHTLRLRAEEHGIDLTAIGYHHDIRPANILLTEKTFLLADFSLAKLKFTDDRSQTTWKAGTGDYIAPECMDEQFREQEVGRAIDIWAFGCLLIEVATYMERGSAGLEQFRNQRLSATFMPNWYEQYFFANQQLKATVRDWLQQLVTNPRDELTADLVQLALSILKIDPAERPTADQVCRDLSYLSDKALFWAVREAFTKYLNMGRQRGEDGPPLMRIWFENERLKALGTVLGCFKYQVRAPNLSELESFFVVSRKTLLALFHKLNSEVTRCLSVTSSLSSETDINLTTSFDEDIMALVQSLVDMLPVKFQKWMETVWEQSSLDTRDIDRLNRIEANCRSVNQVQYLQVSALAAMKSLRLQFLNGNGANSRDRLLTKEDVKVTGSIQGHFIGLYHNELQVLVEWLSYSPKWMSMPIAQRTLLMELKAEGLGMKPKPSGLRILDCVGFFEETIEQYGYGFLYAFPDGYSIHDSTPPTTLLALLNYDLKTQKTIDMQPLLGAKFKLASALVNYLKELHLIGWLHENINSNNILFFGIPLGMPLPSERLQEPYVVGYERSRPDSDIWYTEGPSENSFTDYCSPKYKRESRFVPAYDYYSMGLILLEIGLWTPLSFWSERRPFATPEEFRKILIDTYVPRLGQKMGTVYRDVVMTCLNGELENEDSSIGQVDGQDGFGQFVEKVVEPLGELARVTI